MSDATTYSAETAMGRDFRRIFVDSYGGGARDVRVWMHDDVVLGLIDLDLTPAERTLVEAGRGEGVVEMRNAFQTAIGPTFCAAVERATGRRVIAFLSNTSLDPPFASELFRLTPDERQRA